MSKSDSSYVKPIACLVTVLLRVIAAHKYVIYEPKNKQTSGINHISELKVDTGSFNLTHKLKF